MAIMALYSGNPMALMALSQMSNNMMSGMMSNMAPGSWRRGLWRRLWDRLWRHGRLRRRQFWRRGLRRYGRLRVMAAVWAATAVWAARLWAAWRRGGNGGYGGYQGGMNPFASIAGQQYAGTQAGTQAGAAGATGDQTGTYLACRCGSSNTRMPRIIPNPFDNTLLVQSTPEEWEQISRLLVQLDVPPRQILVEAKIIEVN
jgi:hypothetical protein